MLKWSQVSSRNLLCERRYSFFETKNDRHVPSSLALMLSVVAFLFVSQSALGAVKTHSKAILSSDPDQPFTLSLADYGAASDGITDDGPALQRALNDLAKAGGGSLFVPDGHYLIATHVAVDFAGQALNIRIFGTAYSGPSPDPGDFGYDLNLTAEFVVKVGGASDALALTNLGSLSIENVCFIGDPGVLA